MYCSISGTRQKICLQSETGFNLPADVFLFISAYSERMADIRVLIVDDLERVRQDLRTFLTLTGDIEIVGEASNGLDAIQLVKTLEPQVVLMDLEMPVMDGYGALPLIKASQPACHVIALTIHGGETEQQRAIQAGANQFIVKGTPVETLLEAIRNVSIGGQMPKGE